ncbi:MAG: hypothetical protein IJ856_04675 [Candidatus Methanomethylophilaceae archaeon]|nr:hypothetical protein [Candidatus Methanomethylophilaceae archaeon]
MIDSILIDCELLEHNPHMGMMPRSGKKKYIGMRYIISGKYPVLYKIDQNRVIIPSIIDTRTKEAARFLDKEKR